MLDSRLFWKDEYPDGEDKAGRCDYSLISIRGEGRVPCLLRKGHEGLHEGDPDKVWKGVRKHLVCSKCQQEVHAECSGTVSLDNFGNAHICECNSGMCGRHSREYRATFTRFGYT